MTYTTMFIVLLISGLITWYIVDRNKKFSVGELIGNIVGTLIGVYIVVCSLAMLGLFFISPFLVWDWLAG